MPRVTEAHRQRRRDEIAEAAVRVLARRGVADTSIADIVAESGLSAGAIYANFANKSELAQYVAASQLGWRVDLLDEPGDGGIRTPTQVLGLILGTLHQQAPPLAVVLQYWSEATRDPDMHRVLTEKVAELRDAFERAVRPWALVRDPAHADALARRTATAMSVLSQGYLANAGLFGWVGPEEFLATAAELLADGR